MVPNLGLLMHHLSFLLDKISDQVLHERLGVGFSQYKVMMAIESARIARQKEIADYLGQTEASISRQIKLLAKKMMIKTTPNPKSKREHLVALTTKGLRMLESATKVLNDYHAPMFESLSPKKREKLAGYLLTMHETACTQPNCPLK